MNKQQKADLFAKKLHKRYPVVNCPLTHSSAWELLVATQLSAQCTDARVNLVTPKLFDRYKTIKDYAESDINELKDLIRSTGFFNNKAKNIQNAAKKIMKDFDGKVPDNMADLIKLPGVARKTANVVLGDWFKSCEGIAVDTHVARISKRHGLTEHTDPVKIEQDLMKLFPKEIWREISLQMIYYGREICKARGHDCQGCLYEN